MDESKADLTGPWGTDVGRGDGLGWDGPDSNGNYDYYYGFNMINSEWGDLFYESLGNKGTLLKDGTPGMSADEANRSPFENLRFDYTLWFGTEYSLDPSKAWWISIGYYLGYQELYNKEGMDYEGRAMAVRSAVLTPPNTSSIADPNGPYLGAAGSPIDFDGTGSYDPDGDQLTYDWDFGDTNTGTGATPSHTYTAAGIYDLCLIVNDGLVDSEEVCTIAVVYDPSAGFVTGGGWIDSPEGAYVPDPTLTGKASFGFISKYKKGMNLPTGQTEFQFKTADMNFHSDSYEWLVVTGSNYATFKGEGKINGDNDANGVPYKFKIWAGNQEADTFRIKIWTENDMGDETVVYDNGFDQVIGGGSIVIHAND